MTFLNKYIKKYGKHFSIAVVFLTLEAFCDLMQPTIMAKIVDVGVANKQMDYVWRMGGLMLLITAFGALAANVRNVISTNVSQKFGAELRSDLFRKIQGLSFENIDQFDRAGLVTRLTNDINQVQMFVNGLMRMFVRAPLLCIGSLFMAVRLNPHLAIVLAVVVPLVAILIMLNMKYGFPYFLKVQQSLDRVNGVIREYLSGVRVVKAFNRFDYEMEKFDQANQDLRVRSTSAMRVMSIFSPGIALTVNIGIVVVLWIGGLRVDHGQMQVGHIIAFINYMTQILFALMLIAMVFTWFVRAKASVSRIGEVFMQENHMTWSESLKETVTEDKDRRGRIDFENVSFSYNGINGEPVLHNITFTCMPGETIGIIGSTGSGKSTLVSLIPRFYDAIAGKIKVDGEDIQYLNPKDLRNKIAIVPQKTVLFTGTIMENIRWGKENASIEEIEKAAQMAQAHEFIASAPEGYESRMGQGGINFSGGQKQRLSIARALVRRPEILILDDCTSAVDVTTEAKIKEALRKNADHVTCLLIAQRITSVMDADKIIVLDHGEIVGMGTHTELIRSCTVYQEIYRSQIGKEVQDECLQ